MAEAKEIIERHALANAVKYGGKANPGAVLGAAVKDTGMAAKDLQAAVQEITAKVNMLSLQEQQRRLEELGAVEKKSRRREGLPDLPNVTGKVVMRIAPYPSGPLHIGNAKQLVLNDEYVKRYGGKLILFYDDTIGSEEKTISPEAYDLIKEGADWMGVVVHEQYYKSDRLSIYYEYAEQIIAKDNAYVCTCPSEVMRDNRAKGIPCACRSASVDETMQHWQEMLQGVYEEGKAVLRIKTDMQHKNPAFRDRVLFRVCEREHPRVQNKYHVWPLLEFSWAIDDHLLGMTHILRGKDLMMETEMEHTIWEIFGWQHPDVIHTGMLQIEGIKLSKSKSKKEVTEGTYAGWDDPRTWSLQSLRKRGIRPEAIRAFVLQGGTGMNDITVPIDSLYAENRKFVESSPRYFFVPTPVKISIEGAPHQKVQVPMHLDHPEMGHRNFLTTEDFYVQQKDLELDEKKTHRLMDCLNFTKQGDSFTFHSRDYEEFKTNRGRIMHWVPVDSAVPVRVVMDDGTVVEGVAESNIAEIEKGSVVQFERFGFVRCETPEEFYFAHK